MFDRDEQEISQIIESGIESILSGRATLEDVLAEHPGEAEEIQGELEGALWLISRRQEVEARPGFVAASRKRVIERIQAEASSQGARRALFGFAWPQRLAYQWVAAAGLILMMILGTGGVVSISQSSLPGDELYAVKRAAEQVAYTVTLSGVDRVELSAQFANRRLSEVENLMARGKYQEAKAILKEYRLQVTQTVALLENIKDANARGKLKVALALKENLLAHADRLDELLTNAPTGLLVDLRAAETATESGVETTNEIIDEIPDATATPTMTTTATETEEPEKSATPVLTQTPLPSSTPDDPSLDGAPDDPILTLTPEDPSKTPRPTHTPKPKNVPDPSGSDNSKKPPKPPKPPKK